MSFQLNILPRTQMIKQSLIVFQRCQDILFDYFVTLMYKQLFDLPISSVMSYKQAQIDHTFPQATSQIPEQPNLETLPISSDFEKSELMNHHQTDSYDLALWLEERETHTSSTQEINFDAQSLFHNSSNATSSKETEYIVHLSERDQSPHKKKNSKEKFSKKNFASFFVNDVLKVFEQLRQNQQKIQDQSVYLQFAISQLKKHSNLETLKQVISKEKISNTLIQRLKSLTKKKKGLCISLQVNLTDHKNLDRLKSILRDKLTQSAYRLHELISQRKINGQDLYKVYVDEYLTNLKKGKIRRKATKTRKLEINHS